MKNIIPFVIIGRSSDYQDDIVDGVSVLKTNVTKVDSVTMFAAISDLSKVILIWKNNVY